DPLDASSVYTSALFAAECPANVTVLDRPGVHEVRPGLQIVAAPWRSKAPTTDLVADVLDGLPADGVTRVLVAHGGVDVLDPDPTKPSLIRLANVQDALARGAVHYVALGDKHSLTEVGNSGRVWYSGSPEVTNYDDVEHDPGHVLVVDIDETDPQRPVTVDARKVGRWRFSTLNRQVDNSRDVADLDLNLDLMPDKDRTVLRLALIGSLTVTDRADLDACLDKYSRLFASLRVWESHSDLAVMPADGEFTDLGIGGFAAAAVEELVQAARDGDADTAGDAQAALALLLRLTDKGHQSRGAA
ncbi:MAG TPA: exonuclease SbcCD subunit D, partial [Mycobacterium sp.]|nr:exonuclease SbcCD subunit D [Mycobacterium sp.]